MSTCIDRRSFVQGVAGSVALGTASYCLANANKAVAEEAPASFEIAPKAIPSDQITEEINADVVVVGRGTSGLVTATSAVEEGLDVVLISASAGPISRGGSNNATYSKVMEAVGIPRVDPEYMRKEIVTNFCNVDQKKWYKHFNNSAAVMNWLIDIMAEAGYGTEVEQGSVIPSDDICYSVPSSHGWVDADHPFPGSTQPLLVAALADRLIAQGGQIFWENIGRQLVRGGEQCGREGRVTGIVAERMDNTFVQYNASKAVVLATGDFSADRELMHKYCPMMADAVSDEVYDAEPDYDKLVSRGGLFKGDGQKMGLWVGAAWQKTYPNAPMGNSTLTGAQPSKFDPFWGLMVDRHGERFMNEYLSFQLASRAYSHADGGVVYAIWDQDFYNAAESWWPTMIPAGRDDNFNMHPLSREEVIANWDAAVEAGSMVRADTLEELVEKLGLPADATLATVARYNELAEADEDADFHKRASALVPIATPPFYRSVSAGIRFLTVLGGLRTNAEMQVCDADDNPIPGLYNVGTMVGDMYVGIYTFQYEGLNYGACCNTFGYLAEKYIAANE